MSVEIGHYALVLAFCTSLALAFVPALGLLASSRSASALGGVSVPAVELARPLAVSLFVLCFCACAMLIRAFRASDFSVLLVWQNSHSQKPMLYKVAAMWGNHEGSMLLWVFVLCLFALAMAFSERKPSRLTLLSLSVQGCLCALFLAFVLFFSNPFARVFPVPWEGEGLNPILQHPALAFHPPMLYLGYVGLSAAFSTTIAGLILDDCSREWAGKARLWTLVAWCCLGAGITLGAFWAYEELGWGGFWFWDPVENASLMPWLMATAALHALRSYIVQLRLHTWAVLLVLLGFSASLLGTFLVRSGVLVSVHSFASDPLRGLVILLCVTLLSGAALALFAWRTGGRGESAFSARSVLPLFSREIAQLLNALLLSLCAGLVMLATLYPLFFELFSQQSLSIGPPYYGVVLTPFFLFLLAVLGLLPVLGWGGSSTARLRRHAMRFVPVACGFGLAFFLATRTSATAAIAAALGAWVLLGAWRTKSAKDARGSALAHAGVGIVVIAIAGASLTDVEKFRSMGKGDRITLNAPLGVETLELRELFERKGVNFTERGARFAFVGKEGKKKGEKGGEAGIDKERGILSPSRRVYPPRGLETTEAAIDRSLLRDIYVTMSYADTRGATSVSDEVVSVRVQSKPLMFWVWGGALVMVIGGVLSLLSPLLPSRKRRR